MAKQTAVIEWNHVLNAWDVYLVVGKVRSRVGTYDSWNDAQARRDKLLIQIGRGR